MNAASPGVRWGIVTACVMAGGLAVPLRRRLAIIYVAAVGEELVFRLLLLSAIAGLAARLLRCPGQVPTRKIEWMANGLSAFAFVALNGFGGLVFGQLFLRRGIVAAMLGHAGADCVIQRLGPLTG